MANNYYEICTSDLYQHITGKLFNDKLEVMHPAPSHSPGIRQQFKQLFGTRFYPTFPNTNEIKNQLWELCVKTTEKPEQ